MSHENHRNCHRKQSTYSDSEIVSNCIEGKAELLNKSGIPAKAAIAILKHFYLIKLRYLQHKTISLQLRWFFPAAFCRAQWSNSQKIAS